MSSGQFVCQACGARHPLPEVRWRCDCGGLLDISLHPVLDKARLRQRRPNLWRYREALPVADDRFIVSLGEGFTPLLDIVMEGRTVLIKQDQLFPTGSYKDRGAAVLISAARERGVSRVVEDSSGNAGAAIAAYCARAGIACDIYVPEPSPASAGSVHSKVVQIRSYGACLYQVPGGREATAEAALRAAETTYYASHSWNPFFLQGTKTFAYELWEQLGWRAPDILVLPVGNGTLLLGAHIGFRELLASGAIERLPKLIGVQAARCAPLALAFDPTAPSGAGRPASGPTLAEGIAVAKPIRGPQILAAVGETGGRFVTVGEDEILAALRTMCAGGCYIEPTAAATIAGLAKVLPDTAPDETVVSVFTGHGLKAPDKLLHL